MPVPSIRLNDGHHIPQLGFGTWRIDNADAAEKVAFALKTGYRHIDTAQFYANEEGVGEGMRRSGLPRGEVFLTTKLWNTDQGGYDKVRKACEASLKRLGLDYLDLYLIHWPAPDLGLYVETWKALIRLREQGLVRSIGVSNFRIEDLKAIMQATNETPAVNQIELHPYFQQAELRAFHDKYGIKTEGWSPLGRGDEFADPALQKIAAAHGKNVAQIILRWHMRLGNIVFPKASSEQHIAQNLAIFDFTLSEAELEIITGLNRDNGRRGHDPAHFSG